MRIAAATDLRACLDELAAAFHLDHPHIDIRPTFGASGALVAQIRTGLEADLFLSADIQYARDLAAAGLAAPDDVFPTGLGGLVIWVRNESPLDVSAQGAGVLGDPTVRRIAIANPRHAPYGRAAMAALAHLGLDRVLAEKFATAESAAQAAQYVDSGAADVGLLPLALARGPRLEERGRFWKVPADHHPPIEHGGVILTKAFDKEAAALFRDFLLGARGSAILTKYGFIPAGAAP